MLKIPVVDLFAGPGGLSHGFSCFRSSNIAFQIGLSIEKDEIAYRTLRLRAFVRQFQRVPANYYRYLRGEPGKTLEFLQNRYRKRWERAEKETKKWTLGKEPFGTVSSAIAEAVKDAPHWVLLGGPPCQAYSVVGRARMKNKKGFSLDHRHNLYREYLKIVAVHEPVVFVMENVKGILSSTHGTRARKGSIIHQILDDLRNPGAAVVEEQDVTGLLPKKRHNYIIYSFVSKATKPETLKPKDFVIQSEDWGVPQKRHRVILLGVRDDIKIAPKTLGELFRRRSATVSGVIDGLPRLRSYISRGEDSADAWREAIRGLLAKEFLASIDDKDVRDQIMTIASQLRVPRMTGRPFISREGKCRPNKLSGWLWTPHLGGVIQHESRSHMRSDLMRYFFAACWAKQKGISPKLRNYPDLLLPNHQNARPSENGDQSRSENEADFQDRFRVQVKDEPATTITSHISKDGHYYIHYDPTQCRSLTVREAARLQTFPDDYFFEGDVTPQYHQVGNAVPPFLAVKLAAVVADLIDRVNKNKGGIKSARRKNVKICE